MNEHGEPVMIKATKSHGSTVTVTYTLTKLSEDETEMRLGFAAIPFSFLGRLKLLVSKAYLHRDGIGHLQEVMKSFRQASERKYKKRAISDASTASYTCDS